MATRRRGRSYYLLVRAARSGGILARPRTHKCHRRHHDDPSVVSTMPMPNQAAHRAPWCFRVGGPVALLSIAVVAIQLRCCSCGRGKPQAPRSIDRSCGLDPRRSQRAHRLSDVSCGWGAIERSGISTHTPHATPARKQFIRFISERRRARPARRRRPRPRQSSASSLLGSCLGKAQKAAAAAAAAAASAHAAPDRWDASP